MENNYYRRRRRGGEVNSKGGNEKKVGVDGACRNGSISVILTDPEVLDCPICFETLIIPVFQCGNGHIACSSCSAKVGKKCPSCCLPIGDNRCRAIERVLDSIKVNCKNEKFGCKETMAISKKSDHEKTCNYVRPPRTNPFGDSDDDFFLTVSRSIKRKGQGALRTEPPQRILVEPSGRVDMGPSNEGSSFTQASTSDPHLSHFYESARALIPESFGHQFSNLSPLSMGKEVTEMAMQLAFTAVRSEACFQNYAVNQSKVVSDLEKKLEKVSKRKQAAESAVKLAEDMQKNLNKRLEDEKIKRKEAEETVDELRKKVKDMEEQLNNAKSWQEEQKKAAIANFRRSDEYYAELDSEFGLGMRTYRKTCLDAGIDLTSVDCLDDEKQEGDDDISEEDAQQEGDDDVSVENEQQEIDDDVSAEDEQQEGEDDVSNEDEGDSDVSGSSYVSGESDEGVSDYD